MKELIVVEEEENSLLLLLSGREGRFATNDGGVVLRLRLEFSVTNKLFILYSFVFNLGVVMMDFCVTQCEFSLVYI